MPPSQWLPYLTPTANGYRYSPGFIACIITSVVVAVLSIVYHLYCVWENRTRDKVGTMEDYEHAYEDGPTDRKASVFILCSVNF
jgi:hypothetical protein